MPTIRIRREHAVGLKKARSAVNGLVKELAAQYPIEYAWHGNTMKLSRPGLSGTLTVSKAEIDVEVELGLTLGFFRARIESEIERALDRLA